MKKFYATFGFGQRYENCFTIILAETFEEARDKMFQKFGRERAFIYTEEQWYNNKGQSQQEEFNLREIKN